MILPNKKPIWRAAIWVALIVIAGVGCAPATGQVVTKPSDTVEPNAVVLRVVDGDTIVVEITGREQPVRLLGIDTPESVARERPVECFGPEASDFTKSLLPAGTRVRLERDLEARDRYDRLLAHVYRADDGLYVNLTIAEQGFADVLSIDPNRAHRTEIAAAVSLAQGQEVGLWGTCGGPDVAIGSGTG